jgi:hypothetical protein
MSGAQPQFAIATPSYSGDFGRCRLLCDSIDRFVSGMAMHYLLIDPVDEALFRPLEGPRRRIITDADLLPAWLKGRKDPFRHGRRIWTGPRALLNRVPPLRGWHVQQLRKFSVARLIPEEVILFADSDIVFLRAYDLGRQMQDGRVRLHARPGGITAQMDPQLRWLASAGRILGAELPALPADDPIGPLVTWRRQTVLALLAHVEALSGRHWAAAIAQDRNFSEYLIYGLYVAARPEEAGNHWVDTESLAAITWFDHEMPEGGVAELMRNMPERQVALCVQSFIGLPVEEMRALFEVASRRDPARDRR